MTAANPTINTDANRDQDVYNAYYLINLCVNNDLSSTSRFRGVSREEHVVTHLTNLRINDELVRTNQRIDYKIILFTSLYDYLINIFGCTKIHRDIITGIKQFYTPNVIPTTSISTHFEILDKIGKERLLLWFNNGLLKYEHISDYFKLAGLEYLI